MEDAAHEMMLTEPQEYTYYTMYRIIHYLAIVSRIYVKHIKMNWIMNDIKYLYLQEIFEFETSELPVRQLKFRLPPREQNLELYKDKEKFILLYKQLQKQRNQKK